MISRDKYIRAWGSRVGGRSLHLDESYFNKIDLDKLYSQYQEESHNHNLNRQKRMDG